MLDELESVVMREDLPDLTGEFVILEKESIGSGGQGHVFKGKYRDIDVAIKKLSKGQDWAQERKAIGFVEHPNIVRVHGHGVEPHYFEPVIVMDLCDGDLHSDDGKKFFWRNGEKHLVGLTGAIKYLHAQNWIHRDIKPANILFKQDPVSVAVGRGSLFVLKRCRMWSCWLILAWRES